MKTILTIKEELKLVALSIILLIPIVGIVFLISALVEASILDRDMLAGTLVTLGAVTLCYSLIENIKVHRRWKASVKKKKDRNTMRTVKTPKEHN